MIGLPADDSCVPKLVVGNKCHQYQILIVLDKNIE